MPVKMDMLPTLFENGVHDVILSEFRSGMRKLTDAEDSPEVPCINVLFADGEDTRLIRCGTEFGNEKATLTIMLRGLFGQDMTTTEMRHVDLELVHDIPVQIITAKKSFRGNAFNEVTKIAPADGELLDYRNYLDTVTASNGKGKK